jgi:hypothetical protein
MAIRRYALPWATIYANSSTVRCIPAGPAIDTARVKRIRYIWEFQGSTDNTQLQVSPGYQTADHEDSWTPSGGTAVGSAVMTQGMQYPSGWTDVTTAVQGELLFRPVWRASNVSANTTNLGRVAGVLEVDDTL